MEYTEVEYTGICFKITTDLRLSLSQLLATFLVWSRSTLALISSVLPVEAIYYL